MNRALRAWTTLVAAASLAACAVGPDYTAPPMSLPAGYLGQQAVAARAASQAADARAWWRGFNDPLLARFVDKALSANLDLEQAAARVAQSRAALRSADAALYPSANITGDASRAHLSVDTPLGRVLNATPGFDRNGSYFEADLGASWELDLFGGIRRGREAARADYEATAAGAAAARLLVASQTAETYVAIRGLQARLEIAEQQVRTREKLREMVDLQFQKGLAAELQVRQTEGAVAEARATLPVLRSNLDAAMNALDVLVGDVPGANRSLLQEAAAIPAAPQLGDVGVPADLLRRRPDLIVAERRLAASNARIGMAVSEYYPKVSLGALLGTATTQSGQLFDNGANQAQAVLGLRWRLFDFGRVDAEIAAARGRNAEALAAYKQSVLRASEDVEDAFSQLVNSEEQARTLVQGEASLAAARKAAFLAYKGGVVSLIEVLDADQRLLAVRDAQAQARTATARAAISSFRALGGGWDASDASRT